MVIKMLVSWVDIVVILWDYKNKNYGLGLIKDILIFILEFERYIF